MKKIMILAVLAMSAAFTASAQKLNNTEVPASVKSSFAKHYPATTAICEKEGGNYEAGFKQGGKTMSAVFEAKGTMMESEMDIKVADLPASVLSYVKAHYKGKSIKEGAKITKADGTVNFEAEVDGKDVIFDSKGNFLRQTKD